MVVKEVFTFLHLSQLGSHLEVIKTYAAYCLIQSIILLCFSIVLKNFCLFWTNLWAKPFHLLFSHLASSIKAWNPNVLVFLQRIVLSKNHPENSNSGKIVNIVSHNKSANWWTSERLHAIIHISTLIDAIGIIVLARLKSNVNSVNSQRLRVIAVILVAWVIVAIRRYLLLFSASSIRVGTTASWSVWSSLINVIVLFNAFWKALTLRTVSPTKSS